MTLENKNLTPEQIRNAAWDKRASQGYLRHVEGYQLNPFFEKVYEKYREELGPAVLDVGCGMGQYLIPMVQRGLKLTGVEPSNGMRKGAEDTLKKFGLEAQIIEGQSTKLNLPSSHFNSAVSIGAIHHDTYPNIQKSFQEIARVLKPGALFIFQTRSRSDTRRERKQIPDTVGYTAVDLDGVKVGVVQHYFTREELERLGLENSFEIVMGPEEQINEKDGKKGARWWVVYQKKS